MKNTGIHAVAQHLQRQGRGKDTILAHIMPEEAAMLKRMGGRGSINPRTGLLEFGVDGGPEAGSTGSAGGNSYGGGGSPSNYTGGSDLGGYSGSGNTSYGGGGGGGGGGGSALSGFTGGGSSPGGTGGGMLSANTPSATSSGGGGWAPTAGNSSSNFMQSIGVPTIVANAAQNVGQNLLNFSDWSTGQYKQMVANPSDYFSGVTAPVVSAATAVGDFFNTPISTPAQTGTPIPGLSFETNPVFTNRVTAADILATPSVNVVPSAPTSAQNAYNWTPGEETRLQNQVFAQDVDRMWGITPAKQGDWGPTPQGENISAEEINRQIMTPTGVAITPTSNISVPGAEENRSPTQQISPTTSIDPYNFSNMQTALMPGTIYGPVTSFGVTPGEVIPGSPIEGQSTVAMNKLVQALKTWAPGSTSGMSDQEIKDKLASNMPEGITLDPKTGQLINTTGLTVDEAIQQLGNWQTKWFNRDVPISQFVSPAVSPASVTPASSDFSVATGPAFTANAAQNLAQNLETEFGNLTKSANLVETAQPSSGLRSEVLTPQYDYTPASQSAVNLPAFAQVPPGSPMAFPETGAAAPQYVGQPAAPANIIDYTTERMTDPRMQPANLRSAIENASLYYGMGYPSLVNMQVTPAGAAGMIANIQRESSFNPAAYNPAEFGFGFAQYQRSRLPGFLEAMGINVANLPADKAARAEAIKTALANTDTRQLGYMLNEIATTKAYAPTYKQLTEGTSPSQVATTYMRNFEGAQMAPERVAAQAVNAERIARTQFAGTQLSPTVTQTIQTSGLTSPQTTQTAIQEGQLGAVLDEGWKQVLAALYPDTASDLPSEDATAASNNLLDNTELTPTTGGGGGGANVYQGYRYPVRYGGKLPVEEPTPPVYTTGMNLTRQTYTPRLSTETLSPAYP